MPFLFEVDMRRNFARRLTKIEKAVEAEEKRKRESTLKTCTKDPTHEWIADIPFCPYCNLSQEARIYYAGEDRKRRKDG